MVIIRYAFQVRDAIQGLIVSLRIFRADCIVLVRRLPINVKLSVKANNKIVSL